MARLSVNLLQLNNRQTRVILVGAVVMVLMVFIPPWVHEYRNELGSARTLFAGYGTLISPPTTTSTYNLYATHVDWLLLLTQVIAAAGILFAALVYLADRNPDTSRLMRNYRR